MWKRILFPLLLAAVRAEWTVNNQFIFYNDTPFLIKGSSWHGLESCAFAPAGLWAHNVSWYLDFLQENRFNVLRVPFSQQWVQDGYKTISPSEDTVSGCDECKGKTSFEILDTVFREAESRGIYILLDMHRHSCAWQDTELWYSLSEGRYNSDSFFETWEKLLEDFEGRSNFIGIDLLNEPRGVACWCDKKEYSWNMFVEYAFQRLDVSKRDFLLFVEGTDWGKDFSGLKSTNLDVNYSKIVFSPHAYGPLVTHVPFVDDPLTLRADWENKFGYLATPPYSHALVIGEFGAIANSIDFTWLQRFVSFLVDFKICGIFWTLTPNSADTGGLLQNDYTTPEKDKLELLDTLQPNPTFFPPQVKLRRKLLR